MSISNQTGKQRSQRIQIDYYRQKTGLDRWRWFCVAAAILLAGTYAMFLFWKMPETTTGAQADSNSINPLAGHFSTGDLANVHASFEQQCDRCHADFTPLDADAPSKWFPLIGVESQISRVHLETKCQHCHPVGHHFREQMTSDFAAIDQNCSFCHRAHQGRDFELTKIGARKCATCHHDLSPVTNEVADVRPRVQGFNRESHGDFVSLQQKDPGRILFSHAQHMMPGQVGVDVRGGMTIDRLSRSDQARYSKDGQVKTDLVQLRCSDCHTIVGQEVVDQIGDQLKSVDIELLGRSMNPIAFDQHCVACHAISPGIVDVMSGLSVMSGQDGTGNTSGNSGENLRLPHAETSDVMANLLAASIDGARAGEKARHRRDNSKQKQPPGFGVPADPVSDWHVTPAEIANAQKHVQQQCLECHDAESITDQAIVAAKLDRSPSMIPTRWLRRGLYDHAAHRLIDCRYCHADAYSSLSELTQADLNPDDHTAVMIAGIDRCQDCHRPSGVAEPESLRDPLIGNMPRWASDQCITCHRYHSPMQNDPPATDPSLARLP